LDAEYETLKEEVKGNFHNEKVVEAMIQYYQLKLKVLESLLEQVQTTKERKQDENEKATNI
jgi:hypothetical protein